MSMFRAPILRRSGRIRGTYVYVVLCQEGRSIFAKIGMSDEPVKRLRELATGCPLDPQVLAYVELPSRSAALQVEQGLHRELLGWRIRGEWFRFKLRDKTAFNAALQRILAEWRKPSWPMKWTKINADELLRKITAARLLADAKKNRAMLSRAVIDEISMWPELNPTANGARASSLLKPS